MSLPFKVQKKGLMIKHFHSNYEPVRTCMTIFDCLYLAIEIMSVKNMEMCFLIFHLHSILLACIIPWINLFRTTSCFQEKLQCSQESQPVAVSTKTLVRKTSQLPFSVAVWLPFTWSPFFWHKLLVLSQLNKCFTDLDLHVWSCEQSKHHKNIFYHLSLRSSLFIKFLLKYPFWKFLY